MDDRLSLLRDSMFEEAGNSNNCDLNENIMNSRNLNGRFKAGPNLV
jgi:hypothetical protein